VSGLDGGKKICTHPCTGNVGDTGCPVGYDCSISDASIGLTCNAVKYGFDPSTGVPLLFGLSCATDATVCNNTGDPNVMPQCRMGPNLTKNPPIPLVNDPAAYCTGSCSTDNDCPLDFRCNTDWDGAQKCIKRSLCDQCVTNDNCPTDFPTCIPGADGTLYCSKACGRDEDCPGSAQMAYWMTCQVSLGATPAGYYCTHRYGSCNGDGQVCAPCRSQSDCAAGLTCIENDASLERFCTKQCTTDAECTSPHPAACDNKTTAANYPTNYCTGDTAKLYTGLLTCWPDQP
jgi:hypothetical protein